MHIILASTSPRRRELVGLYNVAFEFTSADIDETPRAHESPAELVRRLAIAKATIGAQKFPDAIVVGSDTIVWIDGTILGKPVDAADAIRMLKLLRNRAHTVYSGVAVTGGKQSITAVAATTVWMRNYSDQGIAAFVATGEPLDKAAAYAIQANHFHPVDHIDGCFANVMGLPLCHLYRTLKAFGVHVDPPDRACQTYLQIDCPVAQEILKSDGSAGMTSDQ